MFSKFKDLFNFNATERNGILVLIVMSVAIAILPGLYRFYSKPDMIDASGFQREIEALGKDLLVSSNKPFQKAGNMKDANSHLTEEHITLFQFNPNGLPLEKWRQLGLKDWQIKIIQKYESKGGRFKVKEDLGKIYGIENEQYKALEPFILIPEYKEEPANVLPVQKSYQRKCIKVDINTADTNTLQELKGIGPSFARRIVKYRELLGGFYKPEQLLEVYGLDQEKFCMISPYCLLGDGPFRRMNLNTITLNELKKHPYFDFYVAKAIIDRRVSKGKYSSIDQLSEIPLISAELYAKISNYLSL